MTITILGQGFEATSENSVGNHLMKFLADKNFHSFHGITAFTSLAGINGIQKHLENAKHLKSITIITGVHKKDKAMTFIRLKKWMYISANSARNCIKLFKAFYLNKYELAANETKKR